MITPTFPILRPAGSSRSRYPPLFHLGATSPDVPSRVRLISGSSRRRSPRSLFRSRSKQEKGRKGEAGKEACRAEEGRMLQAFVLFFFSLISFAWQESRRARGPGKKEEQPSREDCNAD